MPDSSDMDNVLAAERRKVSVFISVPTHQALIRESAERSVQEGRPVSLSEAARRAIESGLEQRGQGGRAA